ncbi:MAG TPA: hypothetical protein VE990_19340 [Acidimicrobiales bacterium]|nr:hypothetical protein [Acidimicrobiales bacterium]
MTPPMAVNDGSDRAPRLRCDLNLGTLALLPEWSSAPTGGTEAVLAAVAAAGYEGVQGGNPARTKAAGLRATTSGRFLEPAEVDQAVAQWAASGVDAATLHLGTGLEDDDAVDRLAEAVVTASDRHRLALFVELHRATVTQDIWRTVRLVERHPDLRFNGDFSHWYTGLEMTYGDFDAKVAFMAPVLERVRFLHGRVSDSGCIQVPLARAGAAVEHHRRLWAESFRGFLAEAGPGDVIVFAPELLPAAINYAQTVPTDAGRVEEVDRWEEAGRLCELARQTFAEVCALSAPAA